jgi:hypothetical protein
LKVVIKDDSLKVLFVELGDSMALHNAESQGCEGQPVSVESERQSQIKEDP